MKNSAFPLVVNWHITETCNYSCNGCYAKWGHLPEAWKKTSNIRKVIENVAGYYRTHYGAESAPWRLSVVGGEPILFQERTWFTVETAASLGADVSIISNGSHLENIFPFAEKLSQVGISLDSFDEKTNVKIGRHCHGKTLSYEEIARKVQELLSINPKIRIKVNTVVNRHNFDEILVDKVAALGASKYKILRQVPFGGCEGITDDQFRQFLSNNFREDLFASDGFDQHVFVEDSAAMKGSYLMIAPDGRLFQNGDGSDYRYSRPLMDIPFDVALQEVGFSAEKFENRYNSVATDAIIKKMKSVA
ncbi:MAG: radical SAM protein [Fibrobacter sp.]|nr:radical SAM protein [Fibrobacter sp.]